MTGYRRLSVVGSVVDFAMIALPLSLGILIYIIYRSKNIIVFEWISMVGLMNFVDDCRRVFQHIIPIGHGWVLYSAPAGLWAFALLYFVLRVWAGCGGIMKYVSIGAAIVLGDGSEVGQLAIVPGIFDPMDLLCDTTGLMAAWGIFYVRSKSFPLP